MLMVYTKNLILVCTGRDTVYAAKHGIPVLHLCLGITPTGALQRLQLPTVQARCLLGLCDPPRSLWTFWTNSITLYVATAKVRTQE